MAVALDRPVATSGAAPARRWPAVALLGPAAVGLAVAAVLDLVLDVARDRQGSRHGQPIRPGKTGPAEA